MYICICTAVTERDIQRAVNEGAKSINDLRKTLNVGGECGRCTQCARQCLTQARNDLNLALPAG